MKLRWMTEVVMAGVLAVPAMAQAHHPKPPADGDVIAVEPDNPAANPDSPPPPQDALNAYEEQMAVITVQTYEELEKIAEAVRAGQISSDEAEHLAHRCFELNMIRLQFLDTLHQIVATTLPKKGLPAKLDEQPSQITTSEQTLVVAPPNSSPAIPESMAKYLELTPIQIAAIQARMTQEQIKVQPLLQRLSKNRKELATATETKGASNDQIRKLAAEQSRILKQLIVGNSQLQRDIYQILTAPQRRKLDDLGQDDAGVTRRLFARR